MKFLIDTNVIAELRKGPRANPRVRAWLADLAPDVILLSVLTVGEIRRGVEASGVEIPCPRSRSIAGCDGC